MNNDREKDPYGMLLRKPLEATKHWRPAMLSLLSPMVLGMHVEFTSHSGGMGNQVYRIGPLRQ